MILYKLFYLFVFIAVSDALLTIKMVSSWNKWPQISLRNYAELFTFIFITPAHNCM